MGIDLQGLRKRRQEKKSIEEFEFGDLTLRVKRLEYPDLMTLVDALQKIEDIDDQNDMVTKATVINGSEALMFPADAKLEEYLLPMERVALAGFAKTINGLGVTTEEDTVKNSESDPKNSS